MNSNEEVPRATEIFKNRYQFRHVSSKLPGPSQKLSPPLGAPPQMKNVSSPPREIFLKFASPPPESRE